MPDIRKLNAQKWLNSTYSGIRGYIPIKEDGINAGPELFKRFICALQVEIGLDKLGITEVSGIFGKVTIKNCPTIVEGTRDKDNNFVRIIQHALFCKGYNTGDVTGFFGPQTSNAIKKLKFDATGKETSDSSVTPMWFKAILNSDAYICVNNGDPNIRSMQQFFNSSYSSFSGIMPADGHYSKDTNRALIYALQAEEGMDQDTATGGFGPSTAERCPTLSEGSRGNVVKIIQCCLYVNGYKGALDGVYSSETSSLVRSFQSFVCLPVTGIANVSTIKALLVSCGDTSRPAKACDCSTQLSKTKAVALKNAGYEIVGRYLTGFVAGRPKNLTSTELADIFNAGLRVFPIYQEGGNSIEYFASGSEKGKSDGIKAVEAAKSLGIPTGTVIYFAVDYDFLDYQVTKYVIPYFSGVFSSVCCSGSGYLVGVYGSRNTCTRVSNKGYAVSSFVSDMSTGFSGNFGYPLPKNWAFDQFYEFKDRRPTGGKDDRFNTPDGCFDLDKDAYFGRDCGVSFVSRGKKMNSGFKYEGVITVMPEKTIQLPHLTITMTVELVSSCGFTPKEVGTYYKVCESYEAGSVCLSDLSFVTVLHGYEFSFSLLPPESGFSIIDALKQIGKGGGLSSSVLRSLSQQGGVSFTATKSIKDSLSISISGELRPTKASIVIEIENVINRKELHEKIHDDDEPPSDELLQRQRISISGNPFLAFFEAFAVCSSAVSNAAETTWAVTSEWVSKAYERIKSGSSEIIKGMDEFFSTPAGKGVVFLGGIIIVIGLLCTGNFDAAEQTFREMMLQADKFIQPLSGF